MSHFADDETLALIAKLQGELAESQHKVKVLADALESLHWMDKNSAVRLALATVKGE